MFFCNNIFCMWFLSVYNNFNITCVTDEADSVIDIVEGSLFFLRSGTIA